MLLCARLIIPVLGLTKWLMKKTAKQTNKVKNGLIYPCVADAITPQMIILMFSDS